MPLILEVVGEKAVLMGSDARRTFDPQKPITIGRIEGNSWVFAEDYISSRHAEIAYANGRFTIRDSSKNGVFLNSPSNRLPLKRPCEFREGDTLFIDDFEVRVIQATGSPPAPARQPLAQVSSFDDPTIAPGAPGAPDGRNPLALLGAGTAKNYSSGPTFEELNRAAGPVSDHYTPPEVRPEARTTPSVARGKNTPPTDYNPFAKETPIEPDPEVKPKLKVQAQKVVDTRPPDRSTAKEERSRAEVNEAGIRPVSSKQREGLDFEALLAAAGLESVSASPELAQQFGQILKVVVAGLMDVLNAREAIKREFRMQQTSYKDHNHNPIKYSVNVEDALYNLLVKRNSAYLGPVAAFEDAFQDVRNHQMSMLAGMRAAYEHLLARFDPEKLQSEFDRQAKVSPGFLSAKPKYWEMYRDKFHDIVKDGDVNFRRLFGEEFAKAYEDQLMRLRAMTPTERK